MTSAADALGDYEIQRVRVLALLRSDRRAGHATCGNDLLALGIPRYGARLYELRHLGGYGIRTIPRCKMHPWHRGAVHAYELFHDPLPGNDGGQTRFDL